MNIEELFPRALATIVKVLERGENTHRRDDWRSRQVEFHAARAICHLAKLATGDTSEPHLEHAATRLLMALELFQQRGEPKNEFVEVTSPAK